MRTIFADESGFTGPDLLSLDQPVFVLASIAVEEDEARELRKKYFGNVKSPELKHSDLARREQHRGRVVKFLQHLQENPGLFEFSMYHKRFALVCKMVDLLIEPSMRKHGVDVNVRGMNIALANLTYVVCTSVAPSGFFDSLLESFQQLVRKPTRESLARFAELVEPDTGSDVLDSVLRNYHLAVADVGLEVAGAFDADDLDLGLTSAFLMMATWRKAITDPIRLVHDETSAMAKHADVWNAVVDPGLRAKTVGYDRRKMRYPIAVNETLCAPSHDWVGLQLADVVAGAIARAGKAAVGGTDEDEYTKKLLEITGDLEPYGCMMPSDKIDPAELGTIGGDAADPNDYVERIVQAARISRAEE